MMVTTRSARILSSRVAQAIALSGVIAITACQDTTAPEEVVAAAPSELRGSQSAVQDELSSLSSSLDDMTGWSLAALPDGDGKANIVGILNSLRGRLNSGKIEACQQSVTDARSWFASLTETQQIEVGAVGVSLDLIQAALDKASQ
jgi:hypothetical protein